MLFPGHRAGHDGQVLGTVARRKRRLDLLALLCFEQTSCPSMLSSSVDERRKVFQFLMFVAVRRGECEVSKTITPGFNKIGCRFVTEPGPLDHKLIKTNSNQVFFCLIYDEHPLTHSLISSNQQSNRCFLTKPELNGLP